jgi:hypothetical protein
MRPDGVGSAFYGGWAKPEKNTLNRTWTLPIQERELFGVWQVVIVLKTKDGAVDYLSLEGELTEKLKPISQKKVEKVPFEIKFPIKDITIPYPTLWIAGKCSEPFEITIRDRLYSIKPDATSNFLLPVELEFGSYSLIDIVGGSGTSGFRSSYSIFSIKGSFDSEFTEKSFPPKLTKNLRVNRNDKPIPLEIELPGLDNITDFKKITITGRTASKATLLINGQEIMTKKGKFSEEINLKDGDNEIAFTVNLNDKSIDERVIITKIADKPIFKWEYPVEDLVSTKKFQLIKGWAQLDSEIVIDGQRVTIKPIEGQNNLGIFEYDYPIRIGINEIEIVIQNKLGTVRESRFIECDLNKLSFNSVKKLSKILQTTDNEYSIRAQVTAGTIVHVNDKNITLGVYGEIDTKIALEELGSTDIKIEIEKKEIFSNEYPNIRNGKFNLKDVKYINDRQIFYLKSKNIEKIFDFFNYKHFITDIDAGLIEIDLVYQLQKYLGFLLIGKNNLALFTFDEAFLLSLTDIRSIEELVGADPTELITRLNILAEKHAINSTFVVGDANRWQRTLDDLLFEFQEEYLS